MKKDKVKILLVSPYNAKHVGGIGTWSKSILDYFEISETYEIIFQNTANNPLKRNIGNGRIRRMLVGVEDSIVILRRLFYNLINEKPDVVHFTSSASWALSKDRIALFITKTVFKKRFIIHWHFGRIPDICQQRNREYRKLIRIVKQSDISIVLDEHSLNALKKEGCNNVYNIPNPMTSSTYEIAKNIKLNEVFKTRKEGEVLFVGHILKTKGVFELVEACVDSLNVKKLVMVGPVLPDVKEQLITLSQKRGDDHWLEFKGELQREDVYEYYRTCSLFCLPSYTEGFPYVILEAMAFACPIVATKVGAIPEMLSDESGFLVLPKDIAELKNGIDELLTNSTIRNMLGEKAYRRVMSVYSKEVIFKQYANVWNVRKEL